MKKKLSINSLTREELGKYGGGKSSEVVVTRDWKVDIVL